MVALTFSSVAKGQQVQGHHPQLQGYRKQQTLWPMDWRDPEAGDPDTWAGDKDVALSLALQPLESTKPGVPRPVSVFCICVWKHWDPQSDHTKKGQLFLLWQL